MPWRECHQMDERLRFVARRLDGEKMAVLCREFGISRKTGYKIFSRYKNCGVEGLTDRSRRPYRHARQLPFQIEKAIIQLKQEHPSWAQRCRALTRRTICGAPITRASSCSLIAATAIRSPSRTSPADRGGARASATEMRLGKFTWPIVGSITDTLTGVMTFTAARYLVASDVRALIASAGGGRRNDFHEARVSQRGVRTGH
jgi:hypothetical protein